MKNVVFIWKFKVFSHFYSLKRRMNNFVFTFDRNQYIWFQEMNKFNFNSIYSVQIEKSMFFWVITKFENHKNSWPLINWFVDLISSQVSSIPKQRTQNLILLTTSVFLLFLLTFIFWRNQPTDIRYRIQANSLSSNRREYREKKTDFVWISSRRGLLTAARGWCRFENSEMFPETKKPTLSNFARIDLRDMTNMTKQEIDESAVVASGCLRCSKCELYAKCWFCSRNKWVCYFYTVKCSHF